MYVALTHFRGCVVATTSKHLKVQATLIKIHVIIKEFMRSMRVNCVDNSSKVSCNAQRAMRRSNMRVNCVDNSSKVSCNTQRAMRRSNMRVNCVDNSSPSSLSSIELVLFKRIQLLGEKIYFVNRFRKSLLSLPYN